MLLLRSRSIIHRRKKKKYHDDNELFYLLCFEIVFISDNQRAVGILNMLRH